MVRISPARLGALSLLLLGLGIAANVETQVTAASAPEINACALLDTAEIAKLLGVNVESGGRSDSGVGSNGAYSSTCLWNLHLEDSSTGSARNKRNFVILNAHQFPIGSGRAGTFLEDFRKAAADGDIPTQPQPRSIGDEALWWGDGLAVRRGDVSFGLSVFSPGLKSRSQRPGAWEERLAAHVLRRLDRAAATQQR